MAIATPAQPAPPAIDIDPANSPHAKNALIVSIDGLTKRFGDFTAVDTISLKVHEGEIFGFLGPNGAGKSTTIKMICTLLTPTAGTIQVAGHDVRREPDAVRSAIGIVFQDNSLDSGLTALENLEFHCMMYHIPRGERAQRIRDVLALMELTDFKDRIVKTYSGGMRRRLEIARGLLHAPRLLILDEPTVGLDPQTRSYIWEYVRNLRQQHGTTIFMTTHYMDEAEYCDRIAVIDKGRIIASDTPGGLKGTIGTDRIAIATTDNAAAAGYIQRAFGIEAQPHENHLHIDAPDADRFVPRLLTELTGKGLGVEALQIKKPSLEDVFINLTGRKIREEEGGKDERRLTVRRLNKI